jgi:hypothetical protein
VRTANLISEIKKAGLATLHFIGYFSQILIIFFFSFIFSVLQSTHYYRDGNQRDKWKENNEEE